MAAAAVALIIWRTPMIASRKSKWRCSESTANSSLKFPVYREKYREFIDTSRGCAAVAHHIRHRNGELRALVVSGGKTNREIRAGEHGLLGAEKGGLVCPCHGS